MHGTRSTIKKMMLWSLVLVYTAIVYLTLPYGPIIREKIYKSFPPKILESYPLKYQSTQIKEKEKILFSAEGKFGLGIYQLSGHDTINERSRVTAHDAISGFVESRNILYLIDGNAGITIIDAHDPSSPKTLSYIPFEDIVYDVAVKDQYLIAAVGREGLAIIDVSEKETPNVITSVTIPGACKKVVLHGDIMIAASDSAVLHFFDSADMSAPQFVNSMRLPAIVTSLIVEENLLYLACADYGITIVDIADLHPCQEIGTLRLTTTIPRMRYRNGYLLAAGSEAGLMLIDVNKPQQPNIQRVFPTGSAVTDLYQRFYFAYIADNSPKVYYVDIDAGRNVVVYFVTVFLIIVFIASAIYLIRTHQRHHLLNYLALIIIAAIYGYFLRGMIEIPIEAIHFLEYGFLGILVFIALKQHIENALVFFIGACLITLIGTGDEFIQWLLPNRNWDFRDIGFNALSGGLVQLGIWLGIAPQSVKQKITLRSIQVLRRFLIGTALVFALLLSMTPQFNNKLAQQFSFLKFLDNPTPLSEYGYKVFHPEIGGFFSRFEESQLLEYDQKQGQKVADILNEHYRTSYALFINKFTPGNAPFIHEMRVHIFRRDRYYHDRRMFVAYKENLILEHFFGNSLKGSLYKWNDDQMQQCRQQPGDKINEFYVSPVSENIITSFRVRTVWILFFLFSSILFISEELLRRQWRSN